MVTNNQSYVSNLFPPQRLIQFLWKELKTYSEAFSLSSFYSFNLYDVLCYLLSNPYSMSFSYFLFMFSGILLAAKHTKQFICEAAGLWVTASWKIRHDFKTNFGILKDKLKFGNVADRSWGNKRTFYINSFFEFYSEDFLSIQRMTSWCFYEGLEFSC